MSWADDENKLRGGGFSETEIAQYQQEQRSKLISGGFSQKEADDYFGIKNPDLGYLKDKFHENFARAAGTPEKPKQASSFFEALEAGMQVSTAGLAWRKKLPDITLPENADAAYRIASQAATLAGDIPSMIVGAAGGAFLGGGAGLAGGAEAPVLGPVTPVAGALGGSVLGAGAGAFALPAFLRRAMMDHYQKGEIHSAQDFWERASGAFLDAAREGAVGAATTAAGGLTKAFLGPLGYGVGGAVRGTAATAAEIGTMVGVGKTLAGQSIDYRDFTDAALLIGAMHVSTAGAAKTLDVSRKMMEIYARTGVTPQEVVAEAQKSPVTLGQILSNDQAIPDFAQAIEEKARELAIEKAKAEAPVGENGQPNTIDMSQLDVEPPLNPVSENPSKAPQPALKAAEVLSDSSYSEYHAPELPADPDEPMWSEDFSGNRRRLGSDASAGELDPQTEPLKAGAEAPAGHYEAQVLPLDVEPRRGANAAPGELDPQENPQLIQGPERRPATVEESIQNVASRINTDGNAPDARTWSEKFTQAWDGFYKNVYDRLRPVLQLSRELAGEKLSSSMAKAYNRLRNMAGNYDRSVTFLEHGAIRYEDGAKIGKSFKEILQAVPDVNAFRLYAVAKRAMEKASVVADRTGIDYKDAATVVEHYQGEYEPHFRDLVDFNNNLSQYLIDSGIVSQELGQKFRDANRQYVPFYRLLDEGPGGPGGGKQVKNPLHVMEGSSREILDPFQSIIKNTHMYIQLAEKNGAAGELVKLADTAGERAREIFQKVETEAQLTEAMKKDLAEVPFEQRPDVLKALQPGGSRADEVVYFRDGVREVYRTSREVANIFNELDQPTLAPFLKLLSFPAKLERAGILLDPAFIARHAIRNPFTALMFSQNGLSPFHIIEGFSEYMNGGEKFRSWLANGGGGSSAEALDRNYLQKNVFELSKKSGLMDRAWNVVRNPLEAMHAMAKISDSALRLGEFIASTEAGKDVRTAAFESREVIPDAQRVGAQMRLLNATVPFFHMEWQGIEMLARAAVKQPGRVLAAGSMMSLISAGLWALNKDDSRFKDIPDHQRDLFWIFGHNDWQEVDQTNELAVQAAYLRPEDQRREQGGKLYTNEGILFRVPKPFEAGIIFGSTVERVLDKYVKEDPEAFHGFATAILHGMFRIPIPAFAKPIIEQFANRSIFTGNPLVPQSVERNLPELRFSDYTTQTGKALGAILAQTPVIGRMSIASPVVIENYVRSYSGTLGIYALQVADKALTAAGLAPDPVQPLARLADNPVVQGFTIRYPSGGAQSIQNFYDANDEFQMVKFSMQNRAKEGDLEAVEKLAEMQRTEFAGVDLGATQKALANQAQLIHMIWKNPEMKPAEKRQSIDSIYYMMAASARLANETLREQKKIAAAEPNK